MVYSAVNDKYKHYAVSYMYYKGNNVALGLFDGDNSIDVG